jgi:hypothetical protein
LSGIVVLWRAEMSAALSPELALRYLRELSPSVTSCALVDGGALLAGDPRLAPLAGDDPALGDPGRDGALVVRDGEAALAARSGSEAPRALLEFDMRLALAAVRGRC